MTKRGTSKGADFGKREGRERAATAKASGATLGERVQKFFRSLASTGKMAPKSGAARKKPRR